MRDKISRRNFIKHITAVGTAISCTGHCILRAKPQENFKIPVVVTSRGNDWGVKVLTPAWEKYQKTGMMLDAVELGANVVELDPEDTSVGYGGYPNEDGVVELDASIMDGPKRYAGAVASLRNIKTPSSVARRVMERSDHVMLVGEGALRFARAHGFKEENLLTEKARVSWLKWKENLSKDDDWIPPEDGNYDNDYRETGTINVLGVDDKGNVYGITTTSGLAYKIPGRVGDSPIIGAGLYVDNDVGAAGAIGRGEAVIKICGSFLVVEKMREGLSPTDACSYAIERIIKNAGGKPNFDVFFTAVNKQGIVGSCRIWRRDSQKGDSSFINEDGFHTIAAKWVFE